MTSSKRKLFLFGKYSLALLPPKKWLTEMNIKKGDSVELELDKARKRIIIHLGEITPSAPTEGKLTPKNITVENAPKRTAKKSTNPDDWQSIPEL
jgi:bifunctional DNA-binding transcriptional regulator/antitoxin component of YhaV-PrlF toxin-antitoxin module